MTQIPDETSKTTHEREWQGGMRFLPVALFFIAVILIFIGGSAALLYNLFSEYSGIRNIWLLVCGVPFALVIVVIIIIFNL